MAHLRLKRVAEVPLFVWVQRAVGRGAQDDRRDRKVVGYAVTHYVVLRSIYRT